MTQKAITDASLNRRLCDLHSRLSLCFEGAQGQPPPRRPRFFEPKWEDMETVLDAAVELDRAKASSLAMRSAQPTADVERIVRLLRALANDCDATDGWQDAAATPREAADMLEAFAAQPGQTP